MGGQCMWWFGRGGMGGDAVVVEVECTRFLCLSVARVFYDGFRCAYDCRLFRVVFGSRLCCLSVCLSVSSFLFFCLFGRADEQEDRGHGLLNLPACLFVLYSSICITHDKKKSIKTSVVVVW